MQLSTGARLAALTVKSLDAIEEILDHGLHDAQLRAAKLILDRTLPTSRLLTVELPGMANDAHPATQTHLIEKRMAELAARTHAVERESAHTDADLIYDAELIIDADPDPVVQQPLSNPESAQADRAEPAKVRRESTTATNRDPSDPTPDVGLPYGVPRTTTRPADLTRMAGERHMVLDDR